jgi:hypothetical protein
VPVAFCIIAAILSFGVIADAGAGQPGVEVTDGGRTIIYRARPGDTPSGVAQALGVPSAEIDTQLATKGITDASRVPVGFAYRVTNPLVTGIDAAERRIAELEGQLESAATHAGSAERQLAAVQREDQLVLEQRLRLGQLEGRWLLARWAILGLAVALSIAGAVAAIARRRERGARRFARSMAHELEDKRRSSLADRQQSARRIVELEDRVRELESQARSQVQVVPRSA